MLGIYPDHLLHTLNNNLKKNLNFDCNKYFIHIWELDLNGVLLKSEKI